MVRIAASPHRRIAASPHRRIAASPHRRIAASKSARVGPGSVRSVVGVCRRVHDLPGVAMIGHGSPPW
jgi:hypothetical protein